MKGKTTISLLLVALVLAAYLYFFERESLTTDEKEERKGKVYAFEEGDITYLRIMSAGEEVVMEKEGENWIMTAPVEAAVEQSGPGEILRGIVELKTTRIITPGDGEKIDWKAYSLAEPAVRVRFRTKGEAQEQGFSLGKKSVFGGDLYARPEGRDELWILSASEEDTFMKTSADLRDKKITDFRAGNARSIELVYPDAVIQCDRDEQDEWWLTIPPSHRCDHWTVEQYVSMTGALKTLKFAAYTPTDAKQYGFESPELIVRLVLKGRKNPVVLTFGKTTPGGEGVYALSSQVSGLHLVEKSIAGDLFKSAFDFRLKEVLNFFADNLEALEIADGDRLYQFRREGDEWKLLSPFEVPVSGEQMSGLTAGFSHLEIRGVPEEQPEPRKAGLAPPRMKISVKLKNREKKTVVLIGREVETVDRSVKLFGMVEGQEEIFYLDPYIYGGVSEFLKDLEQKPPE